MKHMSHAKFKERSDDLLPPVTGKLQGTSRDLTVVAKKHTDVTRVAANGSTGVFTVRDLWSGLALSFPVKHATAAVLYKLLKWFAGVGWSRKLLIVVESDCDRGGDF